MADQTLVQGVADLRLNEATLRQDLQQARRLILNTARQIERELTITTTIRLDDRSLRREARRITDALSAVGGLTIPVSLGDLSKVLGDTDAAAAAAKQMASRISDTVAEFLGALTVTVAVEGDTTVAQDSVTRFVAETAAEVVTVPVRADVTGVADINEDLLGLANRLDEAARTFGQRRLGGALTIPFEPEIDTSGIAKLTTQIDDQFDALKPSFIVPVDADTVPLISSVRSATEAAEAERITITASVDFNDNLTAKADQLDAAAATFGRRLGRRGGTGDVLTVTAVADTGPLTAAVGAAAEAAEAEPITKVVQANTDPVTASVTAVENQDVDPVVVPITGDSTSLQGQLATARAQLESLSGRVGALRDEFGPTEDFLPPLSGFAEAGAQSGRTFGQSVLSAVQGIFTTGAVTVGGFLALSLVRGFQRFTTIRDSVASLTVQLGSATEAATLLDEVLEVVTGTPFNLDQFAEAASNMVAFGIEAEKIPGYLTAISEVAATRGGRANEYAQRLAISFGQVAVQGRITNDEIQQLALTGVPALQILGNAFGETTFDMREMISRGVVPAGEALDVLAKGILEGSDGINGATVSFEGTAEALRETLTGSIGGFKSATARFGVSIIEPLEGILVDGFKGATAAVDAFGRTIRETLSGFASSDTVDALRGLLSDIPEFAGMAVEALHELGPAVAPLAVVLGGAGLGQVAGLLGPLGKLLPTITTPVGALTAAVAALIATSPELRSEFVPVLTQALTIFGEVAFVLGPALRGAAESAVPVLRQMLGVIDDILPVVGDAAVVGAGVLRILVEGFGLFADILGAFPTGVLTGITVALGTLFVFNKLQSPFTNILNDLTRLRAGAVSAEQPVGLMARGMDKLGLSTKQAATAVTVGTASITAGISGLALASDNTATQITGLVGAISSIGVGFAAGGPIGGALTTGATLVGVIAGNFIEARREAAEFARAVTASADQVVDDLSRVEVATGKVGENFQDFDIRSDPQIYDDFIDALDDDLFDRVREIPGVELTDFFKVDPDKIPEFVGDARELLGAFDREIQAFTFDGIEFDLADVLGTDAAGQLPDTFREVAAALGLIGETLEGLPDDELVLQMDVTNSDKVFQFLEAAEDYNELQADRLRLEQELAGFGLNLDFGSIDQTELETVITVMERYGTATEETRRELERLFEKEQARQQGADDRFREQLGGENFRLATASIEILIEKSRELSDELGETVTPIDLFNTGMLDGVGVMGDAEDLMNDIVQGTVDAEEAAAAWEAAISRVTDEFDAIGGALDVIGARGDAAAALRGIGEGLGEVINEAELRKAEQVADQIDRQLERVQDASERLAKEALEFSFNEQIALQNIAEAEATGQVKNVLAARRQLEGDRLELQQLRDAAAEENRKLGELQAEQAAAAATQPITFGDVLTQQADQLGLSFFDLLLQQPTDDAQEAFKSFVDRPARAALTEIQTVLENEGPAAALAVADGFRTDLLAAWTAQFGGPTARRLTEAVFDLDDGIVRLKALAVAQEFVDRLNDGLSGKRAFIGATNLSDEDFIRGEGAAFLTEMEAILADQALVTALGLDATLFREQLDELAAEMSSQVFQLIPGLTTVNGLGHSVRIGSGPGGGFTALAKGGVLEAHSAHVTSGIRMFGEPETGGEAYIPLTSDPVQRRRSTDVLADVAHRFGLSLAPFDPATFGSDQFGAPAVPVVVEVPSAAPRLDGLVDAVAAGVGRAMTRSQKADMARRYADGVHIEHLHIGASGGERRTARRVVSELADLSLRRRR